MPLGICVWALVSLVSAPLCIPTWRPNSTPALLLYPSCPKFSSLSHLIALPAPSSRETATLSSERSFIPQGHPRGQGQGSGQSAQPSNFFLRPSIPLNASMFLRQSPTSRFSLAGGWGVVGQRLECLPGLQTLRYPPLALPPAGSLVPDAHCRVWFWNTSCPLRQSFPICPLPVSLLHFLSLSCTSCLTPALPVTLLHFLSLSWTSCHLPALPLSLLDLLSPSCTSSLSPALPVTLLHFLSLSYFLSASWTYCLPHALPDSLPLPFSLMHFLSSSSTSSLTLAFPVPLLDFLWRTLTRYFSPQFHLSPPSCWVLGLLPSTSSPKHPLSWTEPHSPSPCPPSSPA